MFDGADNGGLVPGLWPRRRSHARWKPEQLSVLWIALAVLLLLCGLARAQQQPDPRPITWKRCSGTIAAGGTAQTLTLGTGPLRGFFLQNPASETEVLLFDPAGAAVSGSSPELATSASVSTGPGTIFFGNSISVNAATTGHAFICLYGQ
jgi:hypothetical protein